MIAVDTNIIVNAFDDTYPKKREISKKILREITSGVKKGAVTNQILAEFAFVSTKKLDVPLSNDEASSVIEAILSSDNWNVFDYDSRDVINSLSSKSPFWDCLISKTLLKNGIDIIITENIKDFKKLGLKSINPY